MRWIIAGQIFEQKPGSSTLQVQLKILLLWKKTQTEKEKQQQVDKHCLQSLLKLSGLKGKRMASPIQFAKVGTEKATHEPMMMKEERSLPSAKHTGLQREGRHRQKTCEGMYF